MSKGHSARHAPRYGRIVDINRDFRCANCQMLVPGTYAVAGVRNRNHCPYCLWSRHLDWREAGDRLSACRAPMRPVGLTTKASRNRYGDGRDGELMLVHHCTGCETLDINRIAADDDAVGLMVAFEYSQAFAMLHDDTLRRSGIVLLGPADTALVERRLGLAVTAGD